MRTPSILLLTLLTSACPAPTPTTDGGTGTPDGGAPDDQFNPDDYPSLPGWCFGTLDTNDDGTVEKALRRGYDANGNVISQQRINVADGANYLEGEVVAVFNSDNLVTRVDERFWTSATALPSSSFDLYSYNTADLLSRQEHGVTPEGAEIIVEEIRYTYNDDGLLERAEYDPRDYYEFYNYDDPWARSVTYDGESRIASIAFDVFRDNEVDQRVTYTYESTELGYVETETTTASGDLDTIEREVVQVFERRGHNPEPLVVERRIDSPFDGVVDETHHFDYDDELPIEEAPTYVEFRNGEGDVTYWLEREIDDGGNVVSERCRFNDVTTSAVFEYDCE